MTAPQTLPPSKGQIDINSLPEVEAMELTDEDKRQLARFEQIDLESIDRLTDSGRQLVQWGMAALGLVFAALALINNQAVLSALQRPESKIVATITILSFMGALIGGFFVGITKRYHIATTNLTLMARQVDDVFRGKNRLLIFGSFCFVTGGIALGVLIVMVTSAL